ncbi:MAG: bacteriohopanetetrol glucosamine biosynthesis glycosyltransferase HpnI [Candidatus Elarobacter sp.]
MREIARRFVATATCGAVLASLAYGAFALTQVVRFARRPVHEPSIPGTRGPTVTVLKPLRGAEPSLGELLGTFCEQDYRGFEVLLGARDPDDPALAVARAVAARWPRRARVVGGNDATPAHANPKIATLAAMLPYAHGDVLVISDGDMRVDRGYLRAVTAPFADPDGGAVTCLYRGEPAGPGLAAALGAQAHHEYFAPSALVAQRLLPQKFCFGATMAVRRDLLAAFGGLDALGPFLADDARLGELVVAHGKRVVLSRYVVENVVTERGLRALWEHELRWARTHRTLEPGGYAGLFLTYPVALALLHLPFARRRGRALVLLALALASRLALTAATRRAFGVRSAARGWRIPVRDGLGFAVWAASFFGRDVRWRDDAFVVRRDGTLERRGASDVSAR